MIGRGTFGNWKTPLSTPFVICRGELIELRHLPEHLIPKDGAVLLPMGLTLREVEERTIRQALQRNGWKKMVTARELGIDKNTLRRKIKRFGISAPSPGIMGQDQQ